MIVSALTLVDEGPPQIFRDPVEEEAGKHSTEECCGNLNVVMLCTHHLKAKKIKYLCFRKLLQFSESKNKSRKGV